MMLSGKAARQYYCGALLSLLLLHSDSFARRHDGGGEYLAPVASSPTQTAAPAARCDERWAKEIADYELADKRQAPKKNGVLFVGSSSIRMWNDLARDFPGQNVINRGFGGSRVADSICYADRIVFPYRPRLVVLYAGDNDLAAGLASDQVFADFKDFVGRVRERLPATRIAFIAIKPSPSRWKLRDEVNRANALIKDYAAGEKNLTYIDVYTPMLGADGRPREELFGPDKLHMNRRGYDVWRNVIGPHLR